MKSALASALARARVEEKEPERLQGSTHALMHAGCARSLGSRLVSLNFHPIYTSAHYCLRSGETGHMSLLKGGDFPSMPTTFLPITPPWRSGCIKVVVNRGKGTERGSGPCHSLSCPCWERLLQIAWTTIHARCSVTKRPGNLVWRCGSTTRGPCTLMRMPREDRHPGPSRMSACLPLPDIDQNIGGG